MLNTCAEADFGLLEPSIATVPFYTLLERREVTPDSGLKAWEYWGTYQDSPESDWFSVSDVTDRFISVHLDVFNPILNLYAPRHANLQSECGRKGRTCSLALRSLP